MLFPVAIECTQIRIAIHTPYHGISHHSFSFPSPAHLTTLSALGNELDSRSRFVMLSVHLLSYGHGAATNIKQTPLCFNCQLHRHARDAKDNHFSSMFSRVTHSCNILSSCRLFSLTTHVGCSIRDLCTLESIVQSKLDRQVAIVFN